ncbi:hypothetical protein JOE45_002117 [Paenibacillus sp. PvR098]|nr:hypothetical protein [Paenibacillus sp. PvP091]MBP1170216.1 hypothetical protein [Paenibacillus sp. PvR098]MBP2441244.1 hypothetical protein [Paenibacillus sp. PvP052]
MSMTKGYAFLDRLSWDNFNESTMLIDVIEKYRERMGNLSDCRPSGSNLPHAREPELLQTAWYPTQRTGVGA